MDAIRTCLACRQKGERGSLLRFVRAPDGEICFDEKAQLAHRGAWLCPKKNCLHKAFEKRLLFRDEKTLPVQATELRERVVKSLEARMLGSLGLLKRMGHCEAGRDAVVRLVKEQKAYAVMIARDLAPRSESELSRQFGANTTAPVVVRAQFSMIELGNCLGRPKTGVVALLKSRITDEILVQAKKLQGLF